MYVKIRQVHYMHDSDVYLASYSRGSMSDSKYSAMYQDIK